MELHKTSLPKAIYMIFDCISIVLHTTFFRWTLLPPHTYTRVESNAVKEINLLFLSVMSCESTTRIIIVLCIKMQKKPDESDMFCNKYHLIL